MPGKKSNEEKKKATRRRAITRRIRKTPAYNQAIVNLAKALKVEQHLSADFLHLLSDQIEDVSTNVLQVVTLLMNPGKQLRHKEKSKRTLKTKYAKLGLAVLIPDVAERKHITEQVNAQLLQKKE